MDCILALVDFSEVTDRVVEEAGRLARAFKTNVCLLHVAAPDPDFVGFGVGPQSVRDTAAQHFHEEHQNLKALEEKLAGAGVGVQALLVQGSTVEKALHEAERLRAGVIIVGSHGHGALRKLLVGSVAEGVLRGTRLPVLVVPSRASV